MNHVIILAAGRGKRMKSKKDKMLFEINGKPLIYYTIMAFNDHPEIDSIVLVVNQDNKEIIEKTIKEFLFQKVKKTILGGNSRKNSFEKGFLSLKDAVKPNDIIIVQNGANPLPSHKEISECIEKTEQTGACVVGHSLTSTIKQIDEKHVIRTHDRNRLFAAETPQAGKYKILKKALINAEENNLEATDEAMMLEAIEQKIAYVKASEDNFKITSRADLTRLKAILGEIPDDFRVGIGQDSHLFEEKKKGLALGGIKFKEEPKLKANSDGDVILHAVFNALSQAIGYKSIGFYADSLCEEGIKESKKYLNFILKKVKEEKFKINSLGLMIEAAKPRIDPHVKELKKSLSNLLTVPETRIGITATTGEKSTIFGEGLGIQCFAIISLKKEKC
ncbi:2-C-methyl-D-erythritol 4-phosphate cytidylyltransferase [Candidatus Peregrinibacteria bacterium]|nr:2-C-methyl-D-erythritol 4-phosphate cytidylyltransferase [Candidatus Peregrinibacteria bacterium]